MKVFKSILNWLTLLLTGNGEIADEVIEAGAVDYSGQGRDKHGHHAAKPDKPDEHHRDSRGRQLDDLSGQTIGIYNVLEFDHMKHVGSGTSTLSYYKCQCCVCGRVFVRTRGAILRSNGNYHQGKCQK